MMVTLLSQGMSVTFLPTHSHETSVSNLININIKNDWFYMQNQIAISTIPLL